MPRLHSLTKKTAPSCTLFRFCWLLLLISISPFVFSQTDLSREALEAEALTAFEEENWELAHRRLAELLSLDGTNRQLQTRYAATLLHDARLREEGIQRMAALAQEGEMDGEGWYWWGRALMLQGGGEEASTSLRRALAMAGKKAKWREGCELALRQSESLPVRFETRQGLTKLEAVDVPRLSYHRYIQWDREGVRIMLAPEDLQSKLDVKRHVVAPVTFWRGKREVFFHSLGSKGDSGMDLWIGRLDEEGEFSESERLPDWVNSSDQEFNPVWDETDQCLYFSSNRPGTVGGMDIWRSCRVEGVWGRPESLGPLYNSVHDEWAFYPPYGTTSGWLLTGREAAYGGTEVWEVTPDGPPSAPVLLTTTWEVDGNAVPGTLTLTDGRSEEVLAELDLGEATGTWDLIVASGQVVRYSFVTKTGEVIEGTYALPEVESASSVGQRMVMTMVDGKPYLDARPLTRKATLNPELAWGWNLVIDEMVKPEVKPLPIPAPEVEEELADQVEKKPIKQFQTYPWWTEVQKEERALASSVLTAYSPSRKSTEINAEECASVEAYVSQLEQRRAELVDEGVEHVLALASSDILRNETPWEEALRASLNRASELWPVGTLNVEEVARKAKMRWAQAGALYDQGVLPEVRDKSGLIGDGDWVESPWAQGDVAALAQEVEAAKPPTLESASVAWALAHQPDNSENWSDVWQNPRMWDLDDVAGVMEEMVAQSSNQNLDEGRRELMKATLNDVRTRMSLLDSMEPTQGFTEAMRDGVLRQWTALALTLSEFIQTEPSGDDEPVDSVEVTSDSAKDEPPTAQSGFTEAVAEQALRREWVDIWEDMRQLLPAELSQNPTGGNRQDNPDWVEEFTDWLSSTVSDHWMPQDMVTLATKHFESDQPTSSVLSEEQERDAKLENAKNQLADQIRRLPNAGMEAQQARELVLSAWVLSKWRFDPLWSARSPDEILAISPSWHPVAEQGLKRMSVQWAKLKQELPTPIIPDAIDGEVAVLDATETATRENTSGGGDFDKSIEQGATIATDLLEVAESETESEAEANTESETEELNTPANPALMRGACGLHLGWYRKAPNVGEVPVGTRLTSMQGAQGLTRWVLVLPQEVGGKDWTAIQSWLGKSGVTDAFEVHWHGEEWKKGPVAKEDVFLVSEGAGEEEAAANLGNPSGEQMEEGPEAATDSKSSNSPASTSSSSEVSTEARDSGEVTLKERASEGKDGDALGGEGVSKTSTESNSHDAARVETTAKTTSKREEAGDADRTQGNPEQPFNGVQDSTSSGMSFARPAEPSWGTDDVWEHGAPVQLGNLIGTWYAVQVGAFRGVPQKEWIEQAGERLVYEPFPDGLARWYAGVRQDHPSAVERWEELKQFEPFGDAFVVRLRDGVREIIRPGEKVDDENEAPTALTDAESEQLRTTSMNSSEEKLSAPSLQENGDASPATAQDVRAAQVQQTDGAQEDRPLQAFESKPSPEVGASLARIKASEATKWHIDISKYYGTVPSKDVAALLIRAADWGVRSVELFGQTTYSSRTYTDLAEAERVLDEVRREGFPNARLIKEE